MPHEERNKNVKEKQHCNKCSKTFKKNGPHQKEILKKNIFR